jgi:ketosteroid isomerase-like protein
MMDPAEAIAIVRRFNDALNRADVDAMLALMTPDCVFENTQPAPDGERIQGHAAQRAFWAAFFEASTSASIEVEDIFAAGDRCVMLWTYRWTGRDGPEGHVRGVDVYRLAGGLIAEKLSYVKG